MITKTVFGKLNQGGCDMGWGGELQIILIRFR